MKMMKTSIPTCITTLALAALNAGSANAATFAVSTTAPTVDGGDIAMLTSTDSDWGSSVIWGDRPARGQTFTTGSAPGGYILRAITLQAAGNQSDNGDYTIRVGTVSGTTFTGIAAETTGIVTTDVANGDYVTWSFATPVALAANTVYGFDVGRPASGWMSYRNTDNSSYTGGSAYDTGSNAVGGATISTYSHDRVFHLDLDVVPEPSSALLGGIGVLLFLHRRRLG